MNKSESIVKITKAICNVMSEVKGIEKNMTIGKGQNSYKGVQDKDVKKMIGDAMTKNGLCILPISIDAKTDFTKWSETNNYGQEKQKQNTFVEVNCSYLLMHDSGEFIEIAGAGHGADPQDKAMGKATTYALKNALLYSFLVPTGAIDDTDNQHSDTMPEPIKLKEDREAETKLLKEIELSKAILDKCNSLETLKIAYTALSEHMQKCTAKHCTELKEKLTVKK